jgi:hypothetical protein
MSIALSCPNWAYCEEKISITPPETQAMIRLLKGCHASDGACKRLQDSQSVMLNKQRKVMDLQQKRIGQLEADKRSLWKNPWFMMTIGIVAGGAAVIIVRD